MIRWTNVKEKCLQDPVYKANNTHPKVNKFDIDRNFKKIRVATEYKNWKQQTHIVQYVQGTTQLYDSCVVAVQVEPTARLWPRVSSIVNLKSLPKGNKTQTMV